MNLAIKRFRIAVAAAFVLTGVSGGVPQEADARQLNLSRQPDNARPVKALVTALNPAIRSFWAQKDKPGAPLEWHVATTDLNNDGRREVIGKAVQETLCLDGEQCRFYIVTRRNGEWQQILTTEAETLVVSSTYQNGWPVLRTGEGKSFRWQNGSYLRTDIQTNTQFNRETPRFPDQDDITQKSYPSDFSEESSRDTDRNRRQKTESGSNTSEHHGGSPKTRRGSNVTTRVKERAQDAGEQNGGTGDLDLWR